MADNSENPTTTTENPPTIPDAPPQEEEASPAPVPEEERPKTRGRPKGSKDTKPRIRRVPVVIEQEEEEPAAPKAAAKRVQFKEPEPVVAQEPDQPEPPPPQKKSPRTLHREHAQAIAAERRKLAQAKQAHYEGLFDWNLSW